jgi:hypothetical protein
MTDGVETADPSISRVDSQLKTLIAISTLILLCVGIAVVMQAWQMFRGVASQRQQWEYTILAPPDEELQKRLIEIGNAGWEIASARPRHIVRKRPDKGGLRNDSAPTAASGGNEWPAPACATTVTVGLFNGERAVPRTRRFARKILAPTISTGGCR